MTTEGPRVVVVGAGIAGTAAAITAARAGASVTVLDGGSGASTLATGALDFRPWDGKIENETRPTSAFDAGCSLNEAARAVLHALDAYTIGERPARLLTTSGVVRGARGHDAALLDVGGRAPSPRGSVPGSRVAVVRCSRAAWDAEALAAAWREETGESYAAIDAAILRYADERVLPDADFAARHDDPARVGWLADRLRQTLAQANGAFGALVLPPCLGIERACAADLSKRVGLACGEALAMPGGPAGLRFERARDRAFAALGIERVEARATAVEHASGTSRHMTRWVVVTDQGKARTAGAVVLAVGGLLGGGLEYAPSDALPASALPPFACPPVRVTLAAPVRVGAFGRVLDLPGSLFGTEPETLAWPFARDALLERAGVLVGPEGACAADGAAGVGLFAVGEFAADAPRTWLRALASGADAGSSATRVALSAAARSSAPPSGPASRP